MSMTSTAVSLMALAYLVGIPGNYEAWTSIRCTARGLCGCGLHPPHLPRGPREQRRVRARARAGVSRRERRAGGVPGTDAVGLLDRGHPLAGRAAGCGRGCAARHRGGVGGPVARARGWGAVAVSASDL